MLAAAEPAPGVEYREAFAQETGLDDGCADIVTCSQSLHWMEPEPTFAEAARILRPGGVFAAYDYDWPPVVDPELDEAYEEYQRRRAGFRRRHGDPARRRPLAEARASRTHARERPLHATAARSSCTRSRRATPSASSASRAASACRSST